MRTRLDESRGVGTERRGRSGRVQVWVTPSRCPVRPSPGTGSFRRTDISIGVGWKCLFTLPRPFHGNPNTPPIFSANRHPDLWVRNGPPLSQASTPTFPLKCFGLPLPRVLSRSAVIPVEEVSCTPPVTGPRRSLKRLVSVFED